jgi:drug/metabolite transporter (DMT)-like permease
VAEQTLDHKKGIAIAAVGGLAISFDIPMVRLTNGDMWSVQFIRSIVIVAVTLLIWAAARTFFKSSSSLVPGRMGFAVLLLYGLTSICFFYAVYGTTTANLAFLLAFNPMFGALFGWLLLKERPRPQTFLAMLFMISGVLIIVGGGLSGGHLTGDLAALGAALMAALAITLSRMSGKDMGFAALLSAIVPGAVAGVLVFLQGGMEVRAPHWIVLNGAVIMPLAFYSLAMAPVFLPGATVGMFYLLETILAPVWVWLIFNEVPTNQTFVGGSILLGALIAHSVWEMRRARMLPVPASAE